MDICSATGLCKCHSHSDYIFNWLAFCVQCPEKRPEVALVLQGGEGAGKGILFKAMLRLFGRHGIALTRQEQLTGKHNSHLRDALFIFADEAFFAGDKEAVGTLKGLITEPTLIIEPKFVDAFTLPNLRKVAMASNSDWVVPADIDARRFAVFKVSDQRIGERAYFKNIMDQLEGGGYEAMLHDLLNRDLSKFDPRDFPITGALLDQKKRTWDEITEWYFERLVSANGWRSKAGAPQTFEISRDEARSQIEVRMRLRYDQRALATKIGGTLGRLCPALQTVRRDNAGIRSRYYAFPSLSECRRAFEQALKMPAKSINWATGEIASEEKA